MHRSLVFATALVLSLATLATAQGRREAPFSNSSAAWCDDAERSNGRRRGFYCDVKEESLAGVSTFDVDTGGNGGIVVRGTSGPARMRTRITTWGDDDGDARDLARDVRVSSSGGRVRVEGPRWSGGRGGWAVSIELEVPRNAALTLRTLNGGIAVGDVDGRTDATTTNGGIRLDAVVGDVHARTTNGGISARLDGGRARLDRVDLETTNGGITLDAPSGFRANLVAETVHGGIRIDFPITVSGRLNRRIETAIGGGGPDVRLRTVNGGVSVVRR